MIMLCNLKNLFSLSLLTVILLMGSCSCKRNEEVHLNHYETDSQSAVEWKGYKKDGQHEGAFSVTGQNLLVENDKLKGGTFIIPIASIQNFDLPGEVKPALLEHLKSPDFFNLALYPEAKFTIQSVSVYEGGMTPVIEGANHTIKGDFTMLNQTHSISFPAKVVVSNGKLTAEAILSIDRTKWGMNSYSDPSAELYILPNVDLHLKLSASKR